MTTTLLADWIWRPILSPLHIYGLAALLGALAVGAYARSYKTGRLRSTGLLAMRLAVVGALVLLLMGPSTLPPQTVRTTRPKLLVLADTSASMLTADCGGQSRLALARAKWLSPGQIEALSETYDVQLRGFDASVSPLDPSALAGPLEALAVGRVTRIGDSVRTALGELADGGGGSALLVISDGRDSTGEPLGPVAQLARARGVPVHTLCLGGATRQSDIVVVALPAQQYMLAGETSHIIARIHQAGFDKATVTLRLKGPGVDESQPVEFKGKSSVTVRLPVKQDRAGLREYVVSIDPLEGEAETGNNVQSVFMEVTDQRMRVLLLEGEPYWDTKFIAQSLRKDGRIELVQITQVSSQRREGIATRTDKADRRLPATLQEMARYNVVILGRGMDQLLDEKTAALLVKFVSEQGGHVVFARGRAYDPDTVAGRQMGRQLAVLEPVVWGRGVRRNLSLWVTPLGRTHPCFALGQLGDDAAQAIAELPGFTVMPVVSREKTTSTVLARAASAGQARGAATVDGPPALVSMVYGRGRVLAVLGEGLWRWSFLPPALSQYDGVYHVFWSNIVRWLTIGSDFLPGQDVAMKLGLSSVRLGSSQPIEAVAKVAPAGGFTPTVTVTGPDGASRQVVLASTDGVATRKLGHVAPTATGVYTVVMDCPNATPARIEKKFSVYDVNVEKLQSSADPQAMRTLAEQSGGMFMTPDSAADLPARLEARNTQAGATPQPVFIWDTAALLVILLVWAGVEWIVRKRAGLL